MDLFIFVAFTMAFVIAVTISWTVMDYNGVFGRRRRRTIIPVILVSVPFFIFLILNSDELLYALESGNIADTLFSSISEDAVKGETSITANYVENFNGTMITDNVVYYQPINTVIEEKESPFDLGIYEMGDLLE